MSKFQLQILTPDKILYSNHTEFIKLPGAEGEVGVLANHAPVVVMLKEGEIEVKEAGRVQKFAIKRGIFRFLNNHGTCLILE
ncbi:MAG: F0F1 ATP synthase subunit epsilon [Candidatus Omnitrophota bacterium]|nr:MAG: F0F1 ATP synthase subunit epsilon [Candidatus Omnitrophota bacterium]